MANNGPYKTKENCLCSTRTASHCQPEEINGDFMADLESTLLPQALAYGMH